jgi:hypothetical protein
VSRRAWLPGDGDNLGGNGGPAFGVGTHVGQLTHLRRANRYGQQPLRMLTHVIHPPAPGESVRSMAAEHP